jgi:hypothetical protein
MNIIQTINRGTQTVPIKCLAELRKPAFLAHHWQLTLKAPPTLLMDIKMFGKEILETKIGRRSINVGELAVVEREGGVFKIPLPCSFETKTANINYLDKIACGFMIGSRLRFWIASICYRGIA